MLPSLVFHYVKSCFERHSGRCGFYGERFSKAQKGPAQLARCLLDRACGTLGFGSCALPGLRSAEVVEVGVEEIAGDVGLLGILDLDASRVGLVCGKAGLFAKLLLEHV